MKPDRKENWHLSGPRRYPCQWQFQPPDRKRSGAGYPSPLLRADSAGGRLWIFVDQDSTRQRRCGTGAGYACRAIPPRHECRGFPRKLMNGPDEGCIIGENIGEKLQAIMSL